MGATYSVDDDSVADGQGLRRGAAPHAIRSALLSDDRASFDASYAEALAEARDSLELTALFEMLERWRRVALLQQDPPRGGATRCRAADRAAPS